MGQVSVRWLSRLLVIGTASAALLAPVLAVEIGLAPPAGAAATTFSITVNGSSSAAVHLGSGATLTETGLPGAATGTVTFSNSLSTILCVVTLPALQCTSPVSLASGTYLVTAMYSGDATYGSSVSANSVSLTVLAPTTTVAAASPADAPSGSVVTYSATVTSPGGVPTGIVRFRTPTRFLCSGTLSGDTASCTASNAPIGNYTVTATYFGDGVSAASVGRTVLTVYRATATLTCNRLSGRIGASITLSHCAPYSSTNHMGIAPGSFLESGGTLTWSRSFQTTIVSLTGTSPGQGGCPNHFVEHDLTGDVTDGSSPYSLPHDPVSWRVCQNVRSGAVRLVAGTVAQL